MRAAAAALTCLVAGGCGAGAADERPVLTVFAASSAARTVRACTADLQAARVRTASGGSDRLAGQVRLGLRPDVLVSADVRLLEDLRDDGLVAAPVALASNRLVIGLPPGSRVAGIEDLARPGIRIAAAAPSVPAGAAARRVLSRLPPALRRPILANLRSAEPDVAGVVGKVVHGAADAALVYATDVRAAGPRLRAIALGERLRPHTVLGAAVHTRAERPREARALVEDLRRGACRRALRRAGFAAAP